MQNEFIGVVGTLRGYGDDTSFEDNDQMVEKLRGKIAPEGGAPTGESSGLLGSASLAPITHYLPSICFIALLSL